MLLNKLKALTALVVIAGALAGLGLGTSVFEMQAAGPPAEEKEVPEGKGKVGGAPGAEKGPALPAPLIAGRVKAVAKDRSLLVVSLSDFEGEIVALPGFAGEKTIDVAADTRITIDGGKAALADLRTGMKVSVYLSPRGDTPARISALSRPVIHTGSIRAVDVKKRTITLREWKGVDDKTYPVADNVRVFLNGKECPLSGLKPGMNITGYWSFHRGTFHMILADKKSD